ncbi:g2377 [Coccomyxa elongata]
MRRKTSRCQGGCSTSQGACSRSSGAQSPLLDRRVCLRLLAGLAFATGSARQAHAAIVDEDVASRVFDLASYSVVSISDFKVKDGVEVEEGTGSGIVWDRVGPHIVTNYHCIAKLAQDTTKTQRTVVGIEGADGKLSQWPARIVATDAAHDLAVLQIDAPPDTLQPIKLGSSKGLKVGQSVFAIGNPRGLSSTMTAGVVSGLNRAIPSPVNTLTYGAIQTDAPINGGSSGGALLDSSGRLVGISTATFSRKGTGRGSGVNFALPSDLVLDIVPKLIVYGNASGKGLG